MFSNKKLIAYTRESSKGTKAKQAMDSQIYAIQEFANKNNLCINEYVSEFITAKNFLQQKNLQKCLTTFKNSDLIVYSVDRFSRNFKQEATILRHLQKNNINVFFINENFWIKPNDPEQPYRNMDKFKTELHSAHKEREKITERMMRGKRNKKLINLEKKKVLKQNNYPKSNKESGLSIEIDCFISKYNKCTLRVIRLMKNMRV